MRWIRRGMSIALAAGLLAVVSVVAWSGLQWIANGGVQYRSQAGGFEVALGRGWVTEEPHGAHELFSAGRQTPVGGAWAWMWISRTGLDRDDGDLELATAAALDEIRAQWGDLDVEVTEIELWDRPAVRLSYERPMVRNMPRFPGSTASEVRVLSGSFGQLFTVSFGGWRALPTEANEIEEHLELFDPSGTAQVAIPDAKIALDVPADWNEQLPRSPDVPGAVWIATSSPDPPTSWAILWPLADTLAVEVDRSEREAERRGTVLATRWTALGGVRGHELRAVWGTDLSPRTQFRSWIFQTADGRGWQLLAGATSADQLPGRALLASIRSTDG